MYYYVQALYEDGYTVTDEEILDICLFLILILNFEVITIV